MRYISSLLKLKRINISYFYSLSVKNSNLKISCFFEKNCFLFPFFSIFFFISAIYFPFFFFKNSHFENKPLMGFLLQCIFFVQIVRELNNTFTRKVFSRTMHSDDVIGLTRPHQHTSHALLNNKPRLDRYIDPITDKEN